MPSSHLIFCHPLLLPSIFLSIKVFSNESALCIRWPKYWSFSFNISLSNEHSGLISFRMDWLDLLAVQGTLKSLLQHHSSQASILQRLAFFVVLIHHIYLTSCQPSTTSFKHLDNFVQRKHFHSQQEAENAFQEFREAQSMGFYATGISKFISSWQKYVDCSGSYFD